MSRRLFFLILVATFVATSVDAAQLSRTEIDRLLSAPIGDIVTLESAPIGRTQSGTLRLQRFDVYSADARTVLMTADGEVEVPRSEARQFRTIATDGNPFRAALSIDPRTQEVAGVLLSDSDGSFAISGYLGGDNAVDLKLTRSDDAGGGEPAVWQCGGAGPALNASPELGGLSVITNDVLESLIPATATLTSPTPKNVLAASRSATVVIETDNEFLAQKFSGNQANAETYLTNLFAAMNVVYERDLDVTLVKGFTRLWSASTPDPYSQQPTAASGMNPCGSIRNEQLNEFGNYWQANESGRTRAMAAMLSGKMPNNNCSAGVAWVMGSSNMCNQKSGSGGHYSFTMVFKFAQQTASSDLGVVAHELGHNLGADHTHCTDTSASAGLQPIDQCYNGEAAFGCYSGTPTCPVQQTYNGVQATGTLMSYCHITPAGCDSFNVFHPVHEAQLRTVATNNVTSGCFTTGGAPGTFSIANASITEGNSGTQTLNFVVTRTGGTGSGSVTATTSDATATATGAAPISDYVTKTQVLTFAAAGTQNFAVTINGDTRDEDNETFTVTLSAPSAGFSLGAPSSATGTITDNDNAPTVSINSPAAVTEGATITFTVSLSAASGKAISVAHTTASGGGASGATEGSDFSDATGTLNFAADETSKTFNVSTTNDTLDEADTETFTATLSAPTNATLGTSSGTGSLNDNDALPSIAIADTSVTEGGNLQFTVTLTPVSGRTVTVPFSTADGTATVANNDYLQTSSSIQITAGNTTGQIIINTVSDAVDEADETMTVNLGSPTNATVSDGSATGTILDDDITAAAVSIADASLTEGNAGSANMVFTVSIPAAAAQATSVTYSTSPIDASAGSDYTAVTGTATITAGNTSTSIGVPIIGDTVDEWDEQFTVNLAATASSTLADGQAVGTIVDDDSGGDPVYRNGFE